MSIPKLKEFCETHLYHSSKSWTITLGDDDTEHRFGVVYEITNMDDATGDPEFAEYPYLVSASIIVHAPHVSFNESGIGAPTPETLRYDALRYMGGIPIDHTLSLGVKCGDECEGTAFECLAKHFTVFEAKVLIDTPRFGTYAAQKGAGSEIKYLRFKTEAAARKYVKLLANRTGVLSSMIGFILDRPINRMGEDGWSVIGKQIGGVK